MADRVRLDPGQLTSAPRTNYDAVGDIMKAVQAKEEAEFARGRASMPEVRGFDRPADLASGLTPDDWISGGRDFLKSLGSAQSRSEGTNATEDLARGLIANTLGVVVPPLRERAIAGMSPVGQLAGELTHPLNFPGGGAELAAILPFLTKAS